MGFLDILTGKRKIKPPAESRLFAMSTAAVTLEMTLELKSSGKAAIVFQPLATADFTSIVRDMEEVLRGTGEDTGTRSRRPTTRSATAGWCSTTRTSRTSSSASTSSRRRSRTAATATACCARCSRSATPTTSPVYWIYNYKRGAFYPFVPAGGEQRRDTERELRLKAQIGNELPVEPELERWFPLWGIPI